MKKEVLLIVIIISILIITGCSNKSDAYKFKSEYESENNQKAAYGNEKYRTVKIGSDNPFIYSNSKEILNLINSKETFYVYFGSPYCPWCRSIIEEATISARENNIKKIYYVNIWKNFHEEILRDTYELDGNKPKKVKDGTDEYYKLLDKFDRLLNDYTLTTDNNKTIKVGEKRIYAPDFIYVEKGVPKKITTGISSEQKQYNSKLTSKILTDEKYTFDKFFNN